MQPRKHLEQPIKAPLFLSYPRCLIPYNKKMEPWRIFITVTMLLFWSESYNKAGWRHICKIVGAFYMLPDSLLLFPIWKAISDIVRKPSLTLLLCAKLWKFKKLSWMLCLSRLAQHIWYIDPWWNMYGLWSFTMLFLSPGQESHRISKNNKLAQNIVSQ